jgi:hypothetical protein
MRNEQEFTGGPEDSGSPLPKASFEARVGESITQGRADNVHEPPQPSGPATENTDE